MIRNGIFFTTKKAMLLLKTELDKAVDGTYSTGFKHTSLSKWCLEIEVKGFKWKLIEPKLKGYDVKDITNDWFPKDIV